MEASSWRRLRPTATGRTRDGSALLPPSSLPARNHPARDLAHVRLTLSYRDVELLAERGLDISYETVRRWVLKFSPAIAGRLRRRRPRPSDRWHLNEMVVRIAGERMYLWRAIDHDGEVLEMLVQRRRDTRAALRLMRKLLKKQGLAPKLLLTDKLRSYASGVRRLSLTCPHVSQSADATASSSGSSRLDLPSASSTFTLRFTTPSICNATSSPDRLCGSSEERLPHSGEVPSQRHDAWRVLALTACSMEFP